MLFNVAKCRVIHLDCKGNQIGYSQLLFMAALAHYLFLFLSSFFFSPNLEISVRAIHLDPITDCFANVFLPAQTVFRWLHMLVLISYR